MILSAILEFPSSLKLSTAIFPSGSEIKHEVVSGEELRTSEHPETKN